MSVKPVIKPKSPHISRLKMDLITIVSLAHRVAEWSMFLSTGLWFYFSGTSRIAPQIAQKIQQFILFKPILFILLCSCSFYTITEVRFILLRLGIVKITPKAMFYTGIISIAIFFLIATLIFAKIFIPFSI